MDHANISEQQRQHDSRAKYERQDLVQQLKERGRFLLVTLLLLLALAHVLHSHVLNGLSHIKEKRIQRQKTARRELRAKKKTNTAEGQNFCVPLTSSFNTFGRCAN